VLPWGGADVARETADLIITDENYDSIVPGVEEGRIAYSNVRKVIFLLISTGATELVMFTLALDRITGSGFNSVSRYGVAQDYSPTNVMMLNVAPSGYFLIFRMLFWISCTCLMPARF